MPSENLPADQLTRRGLAYARRGEYTKAIETLTGAIDLSPDSADLYFHRGNAFVAMGRHADAIADYSEAVNFKSDFVAAYHNRATAHADLGHHAEAEADYSKAHELSPSDPDPLFDCGGIRAIAVSSSLLAPISSIAAMISDMIRLQIRERVQTLPRALMLSSSISGPTASDSWKAPARSARSGRRMVESTACRIMNSRHSRKLSSSSGLMSTIST